MNYSNIPKKIKNPIKDEDLFSLFDAGNVQTLAELLTSGHRISEKGALWLYNHPRLFTLAQLASLVGEKKNPYVLYNINRHINPTNICVYSCKFCAYAKKITDQGAYAYSLEQIATKAKEAVEVGADEVHVVGGLHPRWGIDHFKKILGTIKEVGPNLHIKGFTAVEIHWLAKRSRLTVQETLETLAESGLGSMPGGGAEVFDEEIRKLITAKLTGQEWLDIHRTAHQLGLHSNATLLYGHVEEPHHRVDHMARLRRLQDETGGFNAFIPLAFQPHNNEMGIRFDTLGLDDLRTQAVARLFLDNFDHIKAYWIMLGQDIAQLSTHFGSHDLDGTVYEEKISRAAGGRAGMMFSQSDLHRLILSAGKVPHRRNTLYELVPMDHHREDMASLRAYQPPYLGEIWPEKRFRESRRALREITEFWPWVATTEDSPQDILNKLPRIPSEVTHPRLWHDVMQFAELYRYQRGDAEPPCTIGPAEFYSTGDDSGIQHDDTEASSSPLASSEIARPKTIIYKIDDLIYNFGIEPHQNSKKAVSAYFDQVAMRHSQGAEQIVSLPLFYPTHDPSPAISKWLNDFKDSGVIALTWHHSPYYPSPSRRDDQPPELTYWGPRLIDELINSGAYTPSLHTPLPIALTIKKDGAGGLALDWEQFFINLASLRTRLLSFATDKIAKSIKPTVMLFTEDKHRTTPSEYLLATSLTRISLPYQVRLTTPFHEIPVLSPREGKGRGRAQRPEEKIIDILFYLGVDDLGFSPPEDWDLESLKRLAHSASRTLSPRSAGSKGLDEETSLQETSRYWEMSHFSVEIDPLRALLTSRF